MVPDSERATQPPAHQGVRSGSSDGAGEKAARVASDMGRSISTDAATSTAGRELIYIYADDRVERSYPAGNMFVDPGGDNVHMA
jgi:hypothetical protein